MGMMEVQVFEKNDTGVKLQLNIRLSVQKGATVFCLRRTESFVKTIQIQCYCFSGRIVRVVDGGEWREEGERYLV